MRRFLVSIRLSTVFCSMLRLAVLIGARVSVLPLKAADPPFSVVMSGLDNPRGLALVELLVAAISGGLMIELDSAYTRKSLWAS